MKLNVCFETPEEIKAFIEKYQEMNKE